MAQIPPNFAHCAQGHEFTKRFGLDFTAKVAAWLITEHQQAEHPIHLSWLELVFALKHDHVPFPVLVSSQQGELWKDASAFSSYARTQSTVAGDLRVVRSFFRLFGSLCNWDIGEIRGLNLSRLRAGPSQNGLSISVSRRALQGLEAALLCFTAARPIRTTNDLARPQ